MANIVIDNKEYSLEELSDEAKAQVANIRYVDQKIADLKSQIAVLNAAREYYSALLKAHLPKDEESVKYDDI